MTKIFGMIFGMPTADREFQFFRPLRGGGRHQVRMVKLFAVCEQIEDENFHGRVSQGMFAILPYGGIRGSGYGRSRRPRQYMQKNSTYAEWRIPVGYCRCAIIGLGIAFPAKQPFQTAGIPSHLTRARCPMVLPCRLTAGSWRRRSC